MLKNSYVLGIAMLAIQALLNYFFSPWDGLGFVAGLVAGATYVALQRQKMPFREKCKALAVFLALVVLSSFLTGARHVGEYSLPFAMLVSGLLALAYAVCAYLGLLLGSWAYARVSRA